MLTAAAASDGDVAFLFTSDEEANDARCIAAFLNASPLPLAGEVARRAGEGGRSEGLPSPEPLSPQAGEGL